MRIFIIVPLDFKFSTLSAVGQQFEKKVGLLSTILGSLGFSCLHSESFFCTFCKKEFVWILCFVDTVRSPGGLSPV